MSVIPVEIFQMQNNKGFNQLALFSDKSSYIWSVYSQGHVDLLKWTSKI